MPARRIGLQDERVTTSACLYAIRVKGRLGPTVLSAFPTMGCELEGGESVLVGVVEDRSALFGVIGQIEALGLELLEVRRIGTGSRSPGSGDDDSPGGLEA